MPGLPPPSTSSPASSSLITLWLSIGSKPWRKMIWISREKHSREAGVWGARRRKRRGRSGKGEGRVPWAAFLELRQQHSQELVCIVNHRELSFLSQARGEDHSY